MAKLHLIELQQLSFKMSLEALVLASTSQSLALVLALKTYVLALAMTPESLALILALNI